MGQDNIAANRIQIRRSIEMLANAMNQAPDTAMSVSSGFVLTCGMLRKIGCQSYLHAKK